MRELGYGVDKSGPGWEWDVAGVPRDLIEKFSRRTGVINAKADELGITSDKGRDQLGALTREAKRDDLSMEELKEIWSRRLTEEETRALETAKGQRGNTRDITPNEALGYALEHSLLRNSTVRIMVAIVIPESGQVSPQA